MENKGTSQLVIHNDPFNPSDITSLSVPAGTTVELLLNHVNFDNEFYDLVIAKNQVILDVDAIVEDQDIISFVIVPKGGGGGSKNILATVAMIAITVAASTVVGPWAALMWGAEGASVVGAVAVAATVMAGQMLVSAVFKPTIDQPNMSDLETSTTYGWNTSGNAIQQGNSVPVLYGTAKVTPQYIGKYLEIVNDSQYLKGLLAVGEGPLDSISLVKINDNLIDTYSNVAFETRLGTNNQSIIPYFNDTWTDQTISKKLTDSSSWQYATTTGDSVTSLVVGLSAPSGVWYAGDSGSLSNYTVSMDIEYKKTTDSTWTNLPLSSKYKDYIYYYVDRNPEMKVSKVQSGLPFEFQYYAKTTGTFDVYKVPVSWQSLNGSAQNAVFVNTVTSLPSTVTQRVYVAEYSQVVWTSAVASQSDLYVAITDKKSSAIRRSYKVEGLEPAQYQVRVKFHSTPETSTRYGSTVYFDFLQEAISDDFIYPNTALLAFNIQATDQLSGGLPKVTCVASRTSGPHGRLDNPAWACYDLLTNTRYGAGISESRIDFDKFSSWASFCSANNYKVNLYLDQSMNLAQSLKMIAQLGRASVVQFGSDFSVIVDQPNPVSTQGFLFSMGNIIQDSFSESFLPLKDRANILNITYFDAENDYERTELEVSQGNYDLVNNANKTSITLYGCTSKSQALKQAKYHLNQNRYLTITASWEASIDSIHCQVGDIVNVAHDVPSWGYSGRLVESTSTYVVVDRDDIAMEAGKNYYIQISNADTDEQIYKKVSSVSGNVVSFEDAGGVIGDYSVYSFGEVNRHAKQFRIISINTAGSLKRKITALEYNSSVYDDSAEIEVNNISSFETYGLSLTESIRANGTVIENVAYLSWRGSSLRYKLSYKKETDTNWTELGYVRNTNYEFVNLDENYKYQFKVDDKILTYTIMGKLIPPDAVENLDISDNVENFVLNWDYTYFPIDFNQFVIMDQLGNYYYTKEKTISIPAIAKTMTFGVYAEDVFGSKSDIRNISRTIEDLPSISTIESFYANNRNNLSWTQVIDARLPSIEYEIRRGTSWTMGQVVSIQSKNDYVATSNGNYHVSARYSNLKNLTLYSGTPKTISVTGANLVSNVTQTFDEISTNWSGTHTHTERVTSGGLTGALTLSNGYTSGEYYLPVSHQVTLSAIQLSKVSINFDVGAVDSNATSIDSITSFDAIQSLDGDLAGQFKCTPQISTSLNGADWGSWANFVSGDYLAKAYKFRLLLESASSSIKPYVTEFTVTVDMPDRYEEGTNEAVSSSGKTITYAIPFSTVPNVQVTILNAQNQDIISVTNSTINGFTVQVLNNGTGVDRNINHISQGY